MIRTKSSEECLKVSTTARWNDPFRVTDFLESPFSHLAGSDADRLAERRSENFSISDRSGLGGRHDGGDDLLLILIGHGDLNFDFRDKCHRIFGAAVLL